MNTIEPGPLGVFFLLLLLTLAIRIGEGTWFSPFSFFGLLWTFIIGFSIFTAPEYFFSVNALGFIGTNIFVFYAGGFITDNILNKRMVPLPDAVPDANSILKIHYYVAVSAGFLALFFLFYDSGIKFTELLGSGKLMNISKILTNNRYEGERLSGHTMLCITLCYSGCLTGGRFFVGGKTWGSKLAAIVVLLPLLLFTLIYTARSVFVFAGLLFLSSVVTNHIMSHKQKVLLFSKRNIVYIGIGIIILPLIFLFTQAVRMGITKVSFESIGFITDHLKIYFSGNLSAFSYWFQEVRSGSHLSLGAYTFAGINEWIGGDPRALGIYGKAIDLDGRMHFSNIYTLFRFLIDDFGITGTIILWFVLGIVCRLIYNKVLMNDHVAGGVLSGFLTWILFSFVTSVFAYNSVLFAWLIYVLITFASEQLTLHNKLDSNDRLIHHQPA